MIPGTVNTVNLRLSGARALKGIVKTGCFTEPSQEMVRHITSIKAQIFILRFGDCTV